jgi:hypothetical protein
VFFDDLDLVSFRIADLEILNTLSVPLDGSDVDPTRHHDIAHFGDFSGEENWGLAGLEVGAGSTGR